MAVVIQLVLMLAFVRATKSQQRRRFPLLLGVVAFDVALVLLVRQMLA